MTRRTRLRKAARIAGYVGVGLVVLAAVLAVGLPIYFRGERFGQLVEHVLPETRGHIHVGGGHWSWSTVIALVRGEPGALSVDDLTITDPEATEVLHIEHVTARVEVHRNPTRITIHDLVIKDARWRFAQMAKEKKVGFLASLEAIPKAGRKKASKPSSTSLSIEGARLDGVEVTFDLPNWGLILRDAHGTAGLAFKGKAFTFEVKDADIRAGGRLRILSEKKGIVLPVERARLDRVATTAEDPDSIRLDASGIVTGASRTSGGGVFTGIYGISPASKHPGIDLKARIDDAADAVNAILANRGLGRRIHVGGKAASVRLGFTQPFDRVAVDAEARGFDLAMNDLDARDISFHVATQPQQGQFAVDHLSLASPEGGRMEAEATVDRLRIDAKVTCARFAARALLPHALRGFAGKSLDGELHARADLREGDAELVRSTLVLTRADGEAGPPAVALLAGASPRVPPGATVVRLSGARLSDGVLRVPRIALGMWGGMFAAEGRIALWDPEARSWLSPPRLDLTLQGKGIQIERLIGSGFARGAISFDARARGTTEDLTLAVDFRDPRVMTVLGEKVRLPTQANLHLRGSTIDLGNLPLGGPGESSFVTSGHISLSGKLALDVGVVRFPIARLPGISGTALPVGGSISGGVRIVGEPKAPSLSGQFTLADVTVAKTSLGGGTIDITPERRGAVRARGHLTDAIAIDGRLGPKASGLEGDLTLTLAKLPLDPFLPKLPTGLKAGGFVSGTGVAHIAPGEPATAEAKLTELTVALSSVDARGQVAATTEVHADNEIVFRVRSGGDMSLGPARFRSGGAWIELAGETHGDDRRASVRGHLDLAAAAPFARTWVKEMAGAVELDLAATNSGGAVDTLVSGSIDVAAPLSVMMVALPVEARIPSGRIRVTKNVVETVALPIVVHGDRLPSAAVSKVEGKARLTGRIDGASAKQGFAAHLALDNLDVYAPLLGRKPVRCTGGVVDVAGEIASGKLDVTRIDLPVSAEAEGLTVMPGATVDRAKASVRLRGAQRQLALSGDLDVGAARLNASALKKTKSAAAAGTAGPVKKKGPLADHPVLEATTLDLRVHSSGGAIQVDVNNLPDLRVDVDMHVGGTVKKPAISGSPTGANVWSRFVLALVRLFT
jgi:hypothetical protein